MQPTERPLIRYVSYRSHSNEHTCCSPPTRMIHDVYILEVHYPIRQSVIGAYGENIFERVLGRTHRSDSPFPLRSLLLLRKDCHWQSAAPTRGSPLRGIGGVSPTVAEPCDSRLPFSAPGSHQQHSSHSPVPLRHGADGCRINCTLQTAHCKLLRGADLSVAATFSATSIAPRSLAINCELYFILRSFRCPSCFSRPSAERSPPAPFRPGLR